MINKNLKSTLAPFLRRGRRGDSKQRARFVCRLLVLAAFTSQAVTKFFGLTKKKNHVINLFFYNNDECET